MVIPFEHETIHVETERPINVCDWPELHEGTLETGFNVIYMTPNDLQKQRACQITEQGNYEIAKANAESVDAVVAAYNFLIQKAELHNQAAQNELDRVEEERRDKAVELAMYKVLLVAGVVAAALL